MDWNRRSLSAKECTAREPAPSEVPDEAGHGQVEEQRHEEHHRRRHQRVAGPGGTGQRAHQHRPLPSLGEVHDERPGGGDVGAGGEATTS